VIDNRLNQTERNRFAGREPRSCAVAWWQWGARLRIVRMLISVEPRRSWQISQCSAPLPACASGQSAGRDRSSTLDHWCGKTNLQW
jgi:hypothetical protein